MRKIGLRHGFPVLIAFLFVLGACSPLDKKYNEHSMKTDLIRLVIAGDLDTADIPYLTKFIMKEPITGSLDTLTYRQLIDSAEAMKVYVEQKKQEAKQMALRSLDTAVINYNKL